MSQAPNLSYWHESLVTLYVLNLLPLAFIIIILFLLFYLSFIIFFFIGIVPKLSLMLHFIISDLDSENVEVLGLNMYQYIVHVY